MSSTSSLLDISFCKIYQNRAFVSKVLLYICNTFNLLHVRIRFCIFQRTSMQKILVLLHVMSSNISKTYKQFPVKLNTLHNKNIILLSQVHIGQDSTSQSILIKPHHPHTFAVLKYHHQWILYALMKVNSKCYEQVFFLGKRMLVLLITNYASTKPDVLHYHWHHYHHHPQLRSHLTGPAPLDTLWITPNNPSLEYITKTNDGISPLLSPKAEKDLQKQCTQRIGSYCRHHRPLMLTEKEIQPQTPRTSSKDHYHIDKERGTAFFLEPVQQTKNGILHLQLAKLVLQGQIETLYQHSFFASCTNHLTSSIVAKLAIITIMPELPRHVPTPTGASIKSLTDKPTEYCRATDITRSLLSTRVRSCTRVHPSHKNRWNYNTAICRTYKSQLSLLRGGQDVTNVPHAISLICTPTVHLPIYQQPTQVLPVVTRRSQWLRKYAPAGQPRSSKNIYPETFITIGSRILVVAATIREFKNGEFSLTSLVNLKTKCHTPGGWQKDELFHPIHRPNSTLEHHVSYLQTSPQKKTTKPPLHSSFGHRRANKYHSAISLSQQNNHCLEHLEYTLVWVHNEDEFLQAVVSEVHTPVSTPIHPLPNDKRPKLHHPNLSHAPLLKWCDQFLLTKADAPHLRNASILAMVFEIQFHQPLECYYGTIKCAAKRMRTKNTATINYELGYCSMRADQHNSRSTTQYVGGCSTLVVILRQIVYSIDTNRLQNLYQITKIEKRQEEVKSRTMNEVQGQVGQQNKFKQEEQTMRGKLYGGGTSAVFLTGDEIIQRPVLPTSTLPDTGVVKIAVLEIEETSWTPPTLPRATITHHPLELVLSNEGLQRVKDYCRQPSANIIVWSTAAPEVHIQTHHMQSLISHGSPINDEVVALFLEIVCSCINHAFLCPQILPLLELQGWPAISRYFANPLRRKYRTIYRPSMSGEEAVAIPCYVNNCHWVAVVRREIRGQVIFCYSDDLNCIQTEQSIRTQLSQNTLSQILSELCKVGKLQVLYIQAAFQ